MTLKKSQKATSFRKVLSCAVRHSLSRIRKGTIFMRNIALSEQESMSFHLSPGGRSVTIMGLVESFSGLISNADSGLASNADSGLISNAVRGTLTTHSFTDYEGE